MAGRAVFVCYKFLLSPLHIRAGFKQQVFPVSVALAQQRNYSSQRIIPPPAKYGGRHTVTMIPGDGIGPELMLHVKEVFRHACVPVDFEVVNVNSTASDEEDIQNAITAIRRNRVALKGNIETNHNMPPSHRSRNNLLRTSLDLYANVIHCQSLPGVQTRQKEIDILIVRENTEGEYSSLEHESVSGVVESLKIITRTNSLRIAEYAFKLAREKGRKKITAVHKANIMKLGDGLFLQCCKEVASGYPDITFESMIVDNTTMQLVSSPQKFEVMVMPNLYGNIVNNVCAGLVGGPGLVPGANYGSVYAVFETSGNGPDTHERNKNGTKTEQKRSAMQLTSEEEEFAYGQPHSLKKKMKNCQHLERKRNENATKKCQTHSTCLLIGT